MGLQFANTTLELIGLVLLVRRCVHCLVLGTSVELPPRDSDDRQRPGLNHVQVGLLRRPMTDTQFII